MSNPYLALRTRVEDILFNGRGADGSLGADAQNKSIPVGRFRTSVDNAPVRGVPSSWTDRAVRLDWRSMGYDGLVPNPLDGPQIKVARVLVSHAVVYGADNAGQVVAASGETPATVVLQSQERALMDADRIIRALQCPSLIRDTADTNPVPLACTMDGECVLDDGGDGRMYASSQFVLRYQVDNADNNDP